MSCGQKPVLVLGDFNARYPACDMGKANSRGRIISEWTGSLDLVLLNDGFVPTCVHPRRESSIDLSMASSSVARMIGGWQVAVDIESLSDHRYIFMRVQECVVGPPRKNKSDRYFPRWNISKINIDLLNATVSIKACPSPHGDVAAEFLAGGLSRALAEISDVSMPRVRSTGRPSVYWWNEEIAELRTRCMQVRRRIIKRRKRYKDSETVRGLWAELRDVRSALRGAIRRSKISLWRGLLDTLDRDPWGMPYCIVLNKLRGVLPGSPRLSSLQW
ncbi:uncharacterized protein [Mycetomoellerius zeteki]|uniref:uncharacterized protein n=1 Tax=Mycetomoellerius zeteki TaxID=64791 RepID=UPI00084EBB58|nr:PREDICTED: uncharacterized protein LOC108721833 [Trachymyrmex zeteki]